MELTPLAPSSRDLLMLRKLYYADRSFTRDRFNKEGPQRGTPTVVCDGGVAHGCRRFEHVPADKGDAVLPLREVKGKRGCLPPGGHGPCFDETYVPPPPPPKKKKEKAAKPKPTPAAESMPTESMPPPAGPQAPPPVQR